MCVGVRGGGGCLSCQSILIGVCRGEGGGGEGCLPGLCDVKRF